MRFAGARLGGGISLVLLLSLGLLAAGAAARELSPREEAALFSFADLGPVDLRLKSVTVETYVGPEAELAPCRRMLPLVWERVQLFYASMGVWLRQEPGGPAPGKLAPAQRLRIEILPDKEWLAKSFKAFEVPPPFRLRFLQVCKDKCAFAHLPLSTIHISFRRFQEAGADLEPRRTPHWLANLLIHEVGHLLGLYHAHEFSNHPIPEYLPDKTPNFMGNDIVFKSKLGFVEFQKLLVHSYLSRGKVYQEYQYVNFDPLRYLELVKRHNGYREVPSPKAGKIAGKIKKPRNVMTFDDDDEDEDEDKDDDDLGPALHSGGQKKQVLH
jgi:hypothetical protein